jgi:hypothetical protein
MAILQGKSIGEALTGECIQQKYSKEDAAQRDAVQFG